GFFADSPAAPVFLLDVVRDGTAAASPSGNDRIQRWPEDCHVSVLRYAWLGGSETPPEARLLNALVDAMPRSVRLKEVADGIRATYQQVAKKYPKIIYDWRLALDTEDLVIGRGP